MFCGAPAPPCSSPTVADTTPQQYRTIAKVTRVTAVLEFVAVVVILLIRVGLDRPILTMLPALLLLCVSGAALLVISGTNQRKAEEMESHA